MRSRSHRPPRISASMRGRLLQGTGAQVFAQGASILQRLAEVPLFLHFWGPQLYGEWLILTTIPTYLAATDLGFSGAASRRMTMLVAAHDRPSALAVFQTMALSLAVLSTIILFLVVILLSAAPVAHWFHLSTISAIEINKLLLLLTLYTVIDLYANFLCGAFFCVGIYGLATFLLSLARLFEFLLLAGVVAFGGTPAQAGLALSTGAFIGTVALWRLLKPHARWMTPGTRHASRATLRPLIKPALAASAIPMGHAINFQTMRLLVGAWFGPNAVTLFATLRTLTRLGSQITSSLYRIIQAELSIAYGKNDGQLFRMLFRHSTQIALWGSSCLCLMLWFSGDLVFTLWTGGQLEMDPNLFFILLLIVLFNSLWYSAIIAAYATNRITRIAIAFLLANAAAFTIAFALGPGYGLNGIAGVLLLAEICLTAYILPHMMHLMHESWSKWLSTVLLPPWFLVSLLKSKGRT